MKKKIIDKVKNILLKNKKKVKIIGLFFLVIVAIAIFSFSSPGRNVSNFVAEKIYPNSIQDNSYQPKEIEKEFVSENYEKKAPDLVIGAMSDLHADARTFWMVNAFTKRMQVQEEKPDFIIEVGDFIENRDKGEGKQSREEGLFDWETADAGFMDYTPRYHVIGNHEMISLYKKDYEDLTGQKSYYSFMAKDYQIIVLDALYWLSTAEDVELGREKAGAYVGFIPDEEKKWLEKRLQENKQNIIFVHHPLYNLLNSIEIEKLLKKYNDKVVLIVNGHKHKARSLTFAGIDYVDMPSLELQKQYVIIKVKGKKSEVEFINL